MAQTIYNVRIIYVSPDSFLSDTPGSVEVSTGARTFKGIASAIGRSIARTYRTDIFQIEDVRTDIAGRPVHDSGLLLELKRRPEIAGEAATSCLFDLWDL